MSRKRVQDLVLAALNEERAPDEPVMDVASLPCVLKDGINQYLKSVSPTNIQYWVARYVVAHHAWPSRDEIIALMAGREICAGIVVPSHWNAPRACSGFLLRACERYIISIGCDRSLGEEFRYRRFLRRLADVETQVLEKQGKKVRRPRNSCLPTQIFNRGFNQAYNLVIGVCGNHTYYFPGSLRGMVVEPYLHCYKVTVWYFTRLYDNCGNVWEDVQPLTWIECCDAPYEQSRLCESPSQLPSPVEPDRPPGQIGGRGTPPWVEVPSSREPDDFSVLPRQQDEGPGPVLTLGTVPYASSVPGSNSVVPYLGFTVEDLVERYKNDPNYTIEISKAYNRDVVFSIGIGGSPNVGSVPFYVVTAVPVLPPEKSGSDPESGVTVLTSEDLFSMGVTGY